MTGKYPVGNDPIANVPMLPNVPEMSRTLGSNLRRAREAGGLSQKELADICVVPRTTVSRVERGEQEPKLSTLALFSLAMRIPLTSLLEGLDRRLTDLLPSDP